MSRVKLHPTATAAATLLALAALGASPGSAAAQTATWAASATSDTWSTAANWSGGVAPSGSVDVLTLPPSSAGCAGWACGFAVDDIPGLTVGTLQLDSSDNYLIAPLSSADTITLRNGLSFASTAAPASLRLLTRMVVPLSLGAAQTWTLGGVPGTPTQLALGAVTGEAYPLRLTLNGGVTLEAPELDTGPLTISGGGTVAIGSQTAQPVDDIPVSPPPLIGERGVSLASGASLEFTDAGAVSGPISVAPGSYSTLAVGHGVAPDGTVTIEGDLTLRANSTLQLWIDQAAVAAQRAGKQSTFERKQPASEPRQPAPVPQPSLDASQLTAFGTINLNGASLELSQGFTDTQVNCATLAGGQVYTLVSATRIVGTFGGIGNGRVVPLGACNPPGSGPSYAVILSYNTRARPETITATVVGAAQIRALVGRTLTLPAGAATLQSVLAVGGYNTSFNAPTAGTLALTWTAVSQHRRVTVATGANVAGQVGPRKVAIKLTAAGRRLLFAAAHPPAPKPRRPPVSRSKKKHKHHPKPPPPPPPPKPKPVTITATASFTPAGKKVVKVVGRVTLR